MPIKSFTLGYPTKVLLYTERLSARVTIEGHLCSIDTPLRFAYGKGSSLTGLRWPVSLRTLRTVGDLRATFDLYDRPTSRPGYMLFTAPGRWTVSVTEEDGSSVGVAFDVIGRVRQPAPALLGDFVVRRQSVGVASRCGSKSALRQMATMLHLFNGGHGGGFSRHFAPRGVLLSQTPREAIQGRRLIKRFVAGRHRKHESWSAISLAFRVRDRHGNAAYELEYERARGAAFVEEAKAQIAFSCTTGDVIRWEDRVAAAFGPSREG